MSDRTGARLQAVRMRDGIGMRIWNEKNGGMSGKAELLATVDTAATIRVVQ